jgi:Ca2+-binding EF-hand superfamily protein
MDGTIPALSLPEVLMKPRAFVTAILFGSCSVAFASAEIAPLEEQRQQRPQMRFQGMDANGDGRISRAEWRGSDRSFTTHDWNGDGVLSGDEVRPGAARQPGDEVDFDQTRRPEFRNWTERGFTNLDRDRDGGIQRAEWFYDREGFVRADRNRDGVLTRAEFLGNDVDADREDRFEYLDVNNNGRIERSEWHASRDAFEWLDQNNDGVLSRSEGVGDDNEPSDLFAGLDANNDSVITPAEWQWSRRSFARQDQNGDGQLTRRELTNAELQTQETTGGAVGTSGRAVVVDAARGWVDAGIEVQRGDRISVDASGSVTLSNNGSDLAEPAGSRTGRRAESAPLRNEPAGALIARINNGAPMLVGNRRTFVAAESGRLYLSVNDDFLADNTGEYRATVSVGR